MHIIVLNFAVLDVKATIINIFFGLQAADKKLALKISQECDLMLIEHAKPDSLKMVNFVCRSLETYGEINKVWHKTLRELLPHRAYHYDYELFAQMRQQYPAAEFNINHFATVSPWGRRLDESVPDLLSYTPIWNLNPPLEEESKEVVYQNGDLYCIDSNLSLRPLTRIVEEYEHHPFTVGGEFHGIPGNELIPQQWLKINLAYTA